MGLADKSADPTKGVSYGTGEDNFFKALESTQS